MTSELKGDEVRIACRMNGDVTMWLVAVYWKCNLVKHIGSTTNKWLAVKTAWEVADAASIDEVNVAERF